METKSALGEDVQRLDAPKLDTSDFRVAIFRHSGKYKGSLGSHKVLDQPSGDLAKWIDDQVEPLLHDFGGVNAIIECTKAK